MHRAEGFDPAGIAGDALPSLADGIDDGVVVGPEAVREEAFLEVEPEALYGVQLGGVGGQEDGGDVLGHDEVARAMPAGAVHNEHGVRAWGHLAAELVEEGLHDVGPDDRQDQAEGGVALRADGAEQVDGGVALVFDSRGAGAALEPSSAVAAGLADPGLVLQPDFDALGLGMGRRGFGDQIAEFFLKSAWARGSALGCTGRVFCQERSRLFNSFSMPFSL
jgi:hypothetical protein